MNNINNLTFKSQNYDDNKDNNVQNNSDNVFSDDLSDNLQNNINTDTSQNLQEINSTNNENINDNENKENSKSNVTKVKKSNFQTKNRMKNSDNIQKNSANMQNTKNSENTQNTKNSENTQNTKNSENMQNRKSSDNIQNTKSSDNIVNFTKMRTKSVLELIEIAKRMKIDLSSVHERDILSSIISKNLLNGDKVCVEGVLEVTDKYAFIRFSENDYVASSDDIYMPMQLVKKFNMRIGDVVEAEIKDSTAREKSYTVCHVSKLNAKTPQIMQPRESFEKLTALNPNRKINLELHNKTAENTSLRILDCIVPIGFGQRALIVAPPRSGKTVLMQQIAHGITHNHKNAYLMALLIDERPEEVTDMQRSIKGEVLSSNFDEPPSRHVHVVEMALNKAKRLAESGIDVIIIMDSLTRLARAYNTVIPSSGKVLTGGLDANAMQKPKRFFGAARNLENSGSLTIIATALIDSGSRMDEVIFEEFKGTGNAEIVLDRKAAERRMFPALDISKSGTRKEELLRQGNQLSHLWLLRKVLTSMSTVEGLEFLIDKIRATRDNEHFISVMNDAGR